MRRPNAFFFAGDAMPKRPSVRAIVAEFPAGWQDHELIASVEGVSLHEE